MKKYHVLLRMSDYNIEKINGNGKFGDDLGEDPIVCKAHVVTIGETDELMCVSKDRNPNIVKTITTDNTLPGRDVIAAFYPEGCRLLHVPSNNIKEEYYPEEVL